MMEIDRGDIDPRLREPTQAVTQPFSILPPPSSAYPLNPIRLPPPQQQQQSQHQHHSNLPSWPQDAPLPYYSLRTESQPHALPPPDVHSHDNLFAATQPSDGGPVESKRPRACEACRGLKVKCDPDPIKGTCRRCAKAGRPCIVTAPSRKRQKKTDSRVAELEKKINGLEAILHATKDGPTSGSDDGGSYDDGYSARVDSSTQHRIRRERTQSTLDQGVETAGNFQPRPCYPSRPLEGNGQELESSTADGIGLKRRRSEYQDEEPMSDGHHLSIRNEFTVKRSPKKSSDAGNINPLLITETSKSGASSSIMADSTTPSNEYFDVIDKKILDAATAAKIFSYYNNNMAGHMPIVVFPSDVTAGMIRKTKPTLFLAILSVACAQDYPYLQGTLTREIMRAYADRLICKREKSLELIQALQVSTTWYSKDANFYQLIHMAATMGIELGMSTRIKIELWKDESRAKSELAIKNTIDSKRAWLGCYFLCANAAMGSRRQNLIRWTPYMDECLRDLENSKGPLPSDKSLCRWVKLQRLADDLGTQISTDDASHIDISDQKIQYALKGFERQMNEWRKQRSAEVTSPTLTLGFHVVNLYMHDFAMPLDHGLENFRASHTNGSNKNYDSQREVLPPAHVSALTTCLASIHGIFDTFLDFGASDVRTLPVFHFARLLRASVLLITMYFAATTPDSALGNVISSDDMKVDYYLGGLIELLRSGASEGKCYPARQLSIVLDLLQSNFERSKEGKTGLADELAVTPTTMDARPVDTERYAAGQEYRKMQLEGENYPVRPSPPKDQAPPQLPPTPAPAPAPMSTGALHLLSEVAMGNSAPNGHNQVHHNGTDGGWYGYSSHGAAHIGAAPAYVPENYYQPPITGVETAYHPGLQGMYAGFEQAMGMSLGEGDLSIMDDDGFYNIMQAAPGLFEGMG